MELNRVGVQEEQGERPISQEGIADRVAKRRAFLQLHRVGNTGQVIARKLGEKKAKQTSIPGVVCVVAKSKAIAGNTLQLVSTLPSVTAAEARGHACKVNAYALRLLSK